MSHPFKKLNGQRADNSKYIQFFQKLVISNPKKMRRHITNQKKSE